MQASRFSSARLLVTVCVISFGCFLGSFMRIPIVPLLATSLGADTVQVGLVNSAFMVMTGARSIPLGLLSDRLGRRLPLLSGLLLLSGSSFLLYWSQSPLQMGCIYLLFGMGLSAISPTLMSYVADFTPPGALGHAFGWYTMALYGGMTLGPATGGLLGAALGLRSVFLVAGVLILLMFFVAYFCLPTHSRRIEPTSDVASTLKNLLSNQSLIACLLATLGGCVGFGMFVSFMPLYIKDLGLSTTAVGFVFATQALANAVSRVPAGWLYDHLSNRTLLVTAGSTALAMAMVAFGFCRSLPALLATAAGMGFSMGMAFTVICTLIADSVPKKMRGLAMGCYNTSVYAGMLTCSLGMGVVIRKYGFQAGFSLTGAVMMCMLLLFNVLYHPAKA